MYKVNFYSAHRIEWCQRKSIGTLLFEKELKPIMVMYEAFKFLDSYETDYNDAAIFAEIWHDDKLVDCVGYWWSYRKYDSLIEPKKNEDIIWFLDKRADEALKKGLFGIRMSERLQRGW